MACDLYTILGYIEGLELSEEDERHDNMVGIDGDGTSWNLALDKVKSKVKALINTEREE